MYEELFDENVIAKAYPLMFGSPDDPPPAGMDGSRQLTEDIDIFQSLLNDDQIVAPPYNPEQLAQQMEKSTRLQALIRSLSQNVVGHGYEVIPIEPFTEETSKADRAAFDDEKAKLKKLLDHPNDEMPFTELLTIMLIDREATGQGYLEIVPSPSGGIDKIYHIPSHTMRVRRNGNGYIQVRGGRKRWFKKFGDEGSLSAYYGTSEDVPSNEEANEVLQFKVYTPRSTYYGIPRYMPAQAAITGSWLAAQRNVVFFENDAVPRLAVVVEGGSLAPAAADNIKEFLKHDSKGTFNAHRVLVIEANPRAAAAFKPEATRVRFEKLTVGETDDASFLKYMRDNDEEIREAFRIHKVFLGTTTDTNRASAIVGKQVTNEQVFLPEQKNIEYVLNHTIVRRLGLTKVRIKFNPPAAVDMKDRAEIAEVYSKYGGLKIGRAHV